MIHLSADKLTGARSGRVLFENLHFSTLPGHALAIIGPNGVGKSSLLRLIGGLLSPETGQIDLQQGNADQGMRLLARSTPDDGAGLAASCHYLGHRDALKPALTPYELLEFWVQFSGPAPQTLNPQAPKTQAPKTSSGSPSSHADLITHVLRQTGLAHAAHFPALMLSAGQRRRLGLARLILTHRPIWLLDEPATALDTQGQALLWALCQSHLDHNGVLLVATHSPLPLPTTVLDLGARP